MRLPSAERPRTVGAPPPPNAAPGAPDDTPGQRRTTTRAPPGPPRIRNPSWLVYHLEAAMSPTSVRRPVLCRFALAARPGRSGARACRLCPAARGPAAAPGRGGGNRGPCRGDRRVLLLPADEAAGQLAWPARRGSRREQARPRARPAGDPTAGTGAPARQGAAVPAPAGGGMGGGGATALPSSRARATASRRQGRRPPTPQPPTKSGRPISSRATAPAGSCACGARTRMARR